MTFKGDPENSSTSIRQNEKATTSTLIVLRRSDQRSSSRRSTYNDEALSDVPEIDNISRRSTSSKSLGNTLLKALKSR
ncbi:hypothetical protein EJD97_020277, partial [Solanum chilense]